MARRGGASRFRFRVLPSVLLTAAILLLPALLYAWGRQADAFRVERVSVAGGRRIPEKEALRTLRKEFLGRNLFTVTTGDVRAALDDLRYLAAVEVDRDFPTTLRVRLIEHRPAAYVLAKGRWFVVSDTGHVVCEVKGRGTEPKPSAGVPAPAASDEPAPADPSASGGTADVAPAPTPGGTPSAAPTTSAAGASVTSSSAVTAAALAKGPAKMDPVLPRMVSAKLPRAGRPIADEAVRAALRVLAGLPSSLRAKVEVVGVDAAGLASLDLSGGPRVELGDEDRLVAKVLALRAVLDAYRRAGADATFIDVSTPDRPLGRPRLTS